MDWDYALAARMKRRDGEGRPPCVEGRVEACDPFTVSLYGGEVMAPPAPLAVVESAPGYTVSDHAIQKLPWQVGDRVACLWMGRVLVVLGRLN